MRWTRSSGGLVVSTLIPLALVLISCGSVESEAITREFTVSGDPRVAVLTVTRTGGLSGEKSVYTLKGDGRLSFERRARGSTTLVYESFERTLGHREVHDLLAVAVENGLLDISQRELLAAIREPSIADAASVAVEIRVATYTLNGREQGAVSRSFHLPEPWALRRYNPENGEIAGLVEISSAAGELQGCPRDQPASPLTLIEEARASDHGRTGRIQRDPASPVVGHASGTSPGTNPIIRSAARTRCRRSVSVL